MRQVGDASVVLAYLLDETGGDALTRDAGPFCLSSVNLTEVLSRVVERDLAIEDATRALKQVPVEHHDYGRADAVLAARLRAPTRRLGLSLGDRACLALAGRLALPVLTADTAWAELDVGIDIRLSR